MTHGVAATSGHIANNGGIRGHSAGATFPWIVFQKGENIGILTPSGDAYFPVVSCWRYAENLAWLMKQSNINSYHRAEGTGYVSGGNHLRWELKDVRP